MKKTTLKSVRVYAKFQAYSIWLKSTELVRRKNILKTVEYKVDFTFSFLHFSTHIEESAVLQKASSSSKQYK